MRSDRAIAISRRLALAALGAPVLLSPFPAVAQAKPETADALIRSAVRVSLFADAIKEHGLESAFRAQGRFGFFIPLNSAMEKLAGGTIERLRRDKEYARQVILNHITDFAGAITFMGKLENSRDLRNVKTMAGNTLQITTGGGPPRIGGQPIVYNNIRASNGMCHAIDGVLLPQ